MPCLLCSLPCSTCQASPPLFRLARPDRTRLANPPRAYPTSLPSPPDLPVQPFSDRPLLDTSEPTQQSPPTLHRLPSPPSTRAIPTVQPSSGRLPTPDPIRLPTPAPTLQTWPIPTAQAITHQPGSDYSSHFVPRPTTRHTSLHAGPTSHPYPDPTRQACPAHRNTQQGDR